jgi:peptidoglycan/LPS O-acetylase OafA/YrhL
VQHNNNFGVLRLVLASLVIVSHSAEMIDGNRSREALMSIGGKMTFGEWAVDGFFIVSGYLVLKSFENSPSVLDYLRKRALRIYPGFIFCVVLISALSPLVGSTLIEWNWKAYVRAAINVSMLSLPGIQAYPHLPFHSLNGSAWSIVYEFRCYLMVILLGLIGLYRFRIAFLLFTVALLVSYAISWPMYVGPLAKLIGLPQLFIRMAGMFCVGSCFYLFRDQIRLDGRIALAAFVGLCATTFIPTVQETAFAIFGGYLIFWFALGIQSNTLANINNKNDISYGAYLYAWPISGYLIYFFSIRSPLILFLATLPLSLLAGFLSWHIVEKPFVRSSSSKLMLKFEPRAGANDR